MSAEDGWGHGAAQDVSGVSGRKHSALGWQRRERPGHTACPRTATRGVKEEALQQSSLLHLAALGMSQPCEGPCLERIESREKERKLASACDHSLFSLFFLCNSTASSLPVSFPLEPMQRYYPKAQSQRRLEQGQASRTRKRQQNPV